MLMKLVALVVTMLLGVAVSQGLNQALAGTIEYDIDLVNEGAVIPAFDVGLGHLTSVSCNGEVSYPVETGSYIQEWLYLSNGNLGYRVLPNNVSPIIGTSAGTETASWEFSAVIPPFAAFDSPVSIFAGEVGLPVISDNLSFTYVFTSVVPEPPSNLLLAFGVIACWFFGWIVYRRKVTARSFQ
jgi:hypothetical protein